jgi:hypothetical protein
VRLHLLHRRGNIVHVLPRPQQHRLDEPDCFGAQAIVFRTVVPFAPRVEPFPSVDGPEAAARERILEERFLVQGRSLLPGTERDELFLSANQQPSLGYRWCRKQACAHVIRGDPFEGFTGLQDDQLSVLAGDVDLAVVGNR